MRALISILVALTLILPVIIVQTSTSPSISMETEIFSEEVQTRDDNVKELHLSEPLGGRRNVLKDDEIFVNFLHTNLQGKVNYPPETLKHTSTIGTYEQKDLGIEPSSTADIATVAGRFRDLSRDSIITIAMAANGTFFLTCQEPGTASDPLTHTNSAVLVIENTTNIGLGKGENLDMVAADFDGDNYDEIVIVSESLFSNMMLALISVSNSSSSEFTITLHTFIMNWDLNDINAHVSGKYHGISATSGDYNGDGDPDVAVIYRDADTLGYYLSIYSIAPDLSAITRNATIDLGIKNEYRTAADINSGDINGDRKTDIMVAAGGYKNKGEQPFTKSHYDTLDVKVFDVSGDLSSVVAFGDYRDVYTFSSDDNTFRISDITIAVGDFDLDTKEDIFIWAARQVPSTKHIAGFYWTLNCPFDNVILSQTDGAWDESDCGAAAGTTISAQDLSAVHGVAAAGNFDDEDANAEVVLIHRGHNDYCHIQIYDIEAFYIEKEKHTYLNVYAKDYDHKAKMNGRAMDVVAADVDGDGILLGEPFHFRVEGRIVPLIEMGAPPQHIDYIMPNDRSATSPEVLPLTVNNGGFYVQMGTETTSTEKASTTSKNTLDFGVSLDIKAGVDLGVPKKDSVGVSTEITGGFDHHGVDTTGKTQTETKKIDVTDTADNDDFVYFTKNTVDVYRYPILGHLGPNETGTVGQQYAQLIIPSEVDHLKSTGRVLDWYQPIHQVGNIFSYPWTYQGKTIDESIEHYYGTFGDMEKPGWNPGGLSTTNKDSYKMHWGSTEQTDSSKTVSNSFTAGLTLGVSGIATYPGEGQVSGSITASTELGKTFEHSSTTTTTMSQGTYFQLNTPGFKDDAYSYPFSSALYSDDSSMKVQHVIDLNGNQMGDMWKGRSGYNSVNSDPALNLPSSYVSNNQFEFNEQGYDRFDMKGLAFLDSDGNPQSPLFLEGDKITLLVRVYNYAFVPTPDKVKVQVNVLSSDDQHIWTHSGIDLTGDTYSAIPGWGNPEGDPNWKWASTTLDTTSLAGKYLKFLVVLDPDNSISEIEGHDLGVGSMRSDPSDELGLALDVNVEDKYTNNVGLHVQNAYVLEDNIESKSLFCDLKLLAQSPPINASTTRPTVGEDVMLKVKLASHGGMSHGATVSFYDGDPENGGKLFARDFIPYIGEDDFVYARASWSAPQEEGKHDIHVVIDKGMYETDHTNNQKSISIFVQPEDEKDEPFNFLSLVYVFIMLAVLIAIVIVGSYKKERGSDE